jgi:hypothetical protein
VGRDGATPVVPQRQVVAAVAAVAVPLVLAELREWFKQDDETARACRSHLVLYSRRQGAPLARANLEVTIE